MAKVQINVRVDEALRNAVARYCRSRGVILSHFVQEALLDRLEELEDVEDLKKIRHEPTRPLAEVLNDLDPLQRGWAQTGDHHSQDRAPEGHLQEVR